jgi:hypothetical protein
VVAALGLFGCGAVDASDQTLEEDVGQTQSELTASRFSAWTPLPVPPLGKSFNSAVEATTSWQRWSFADVFVKMVPGEQIHVTSRNLVAAGSTWPVWAPLPNNVSLASSPTATTAASCRTLVAAIGTDSRVYMTRRLGSCSSAVNGAGWSNWFPVTPAGYEAAPALAHRAPYTFLLARTGTRIAHFISTDDGATFSGGSLLPVLPDGNATASPDVTAEFNGDSAGNFYAAVRSSSTKAFVLLFDVPGFSWQATWREAPGLYNAGPTYIGAKRTIFGKGLDNGVWQSTGISFLPSGWSAPQEIGNLSAAGTNPGAVDRGIGQGLTLVDVFQRVDATTLLWSAYR